MMSESPAVAKGRLRVWTGRLDVEEYCMSEGWIKVPAGKTLDRKGKPLLIKLKGKVEAFYR